jgi:hypothetical protein
VKLNRLARAGQRQVIAELTLPDFPRKLIRHAVQLR